MLQGFKQFIFRGNVLREPISLKHSTDGGAIIPLTKQTV